MNNQRMYEPYPIPPPSVRIVAIAAQWARRACTVKEFNLFSDISRGSERAILINDAALATAKQTAEVILAQMDQDRIHEAREIIEWANCVAMLRRAGAAPAWSPPMDLMTIDRWSKE